MNIFFLKLLKESTGNVWLEKDIQERLNRATSEIERANEYDAEIKFNNPDEGIKDLKNLLNMSDCEK